MSSAYDTQINSLTAALSDLNTSLSNVTDSDALVEDDTGTHYQTTYTYFYVPSTPGAANTSADDSGLGTLLRLGEYADVEQTAYNAGADTYSAYFPAQHIADESGDAIYTNAAGGGKGILMACDGRILIRGGEKFYLNPKGAMHIQSDEGAITIQSGTDTNGNEQDINLIAGANGLGDLNTTVRKDTKTVDGEQYEKVSSVSRKYYEANKYEIYHANSYKEVHAHTDTRHYGTYFKMFCGGNIQVKIAAEFIFNLAFSLNVEPITKITFYLLKTDIGLVKTDILAWKTEIKEGELKVLGATFRSKAVKVDTTATEATATPVKASTGGITAEQIAAECANVNVKSMISLWEAKIASTAQI